MRLRLLRLQLPPLLCPTVVLFQACESMKKCFTCMHKPISLTKKKKKIWVPGAAGATHLRLWEHTCLELSLRHVYFPSSVAAQPTGSWCSALSAQPCQRSPHTGRAAQWAVWESEALTEGRVEVDGRDLEGGCEHEV